MTTPVPGIRIGGSARIRSKKSLIDIRRCVNPEHGGWHQLTATGSRGGFLEGVEWARPDVAEDDPQSAEDRSLGPIGAHHMMRRSIGSTGRHEPAPPSYAGPGRCINSEALTRSVSSFRRLTIRETSTW